MGFLTSESSSGYLLAKDEDEKTGWYLLCKETIRTHLMAKRGRCKSLTRQAALHRSMLHVRHRISVLITSLAPIAFQPFSTVRFHREQRTATCLNRAPAAAIQRAVDPDSFHGLCSQPLSAPGQNKKFPCRLEAARTRIETAMRDDSDALSPQEPNL